VVSTRRLAPPASPDQLRLSLVHTTQPVKPGVKTIFLNGALHLRPLLPLIPNQVTEPDPYTAIYGSGC
jgi:hypothetical protein